MLESLHPTYVTFTAGLAFALLGNVLALVWHAAVLAAGVKEARETGRALRDLITSHDKRLALLEREIEREYRRS